MACANIRCALNNI